MGLVAPVAAVLGAAIPTLVTAFAEGFPGYRHLFGFLLAGVGVWLISRTESGVGRPEGLGMAVLAGIGFAGSYLYPPGGQRLRIVDSEQLSLRCLAGHGNYRFVRSTRARGRPCSVAGIALAAGILDISGTVVFIRASQIGRLDDAVVLSSLIAVTVLLARIFLHEHSSRARTIGMVAALAAVPMIAG